MNDQNEPVEADEDDFTLDDLGAAYAEAMVEAGLASPAAPPDDSESIEPDDPVSDARSSESMPPPTPEGVVEAALFVGHPDNQPLTAKELARVMRDVSPKEIKAIIKALNDSYEEFGHAMRIVTEAGGYRMVLSPDVEGVRRVFYGKVREARLSQAALEILSLVAYQPGISAHRLARQRGRDCGAILNQLVRRNLLSVTREKVEGKGRRVAFYHPTDRFLNLFGLSSLEDLPQVDESAILP